MIIDVTKGESMDIIKKAFNIVEKKGKNYIEKQDSNWISYTNKDDYIFDFDDFSCEDYCEDCIDKKIKEINKRIKDKDTNIKIPDDFNEICYQTESSKEGYGLCRCDECGEFIHQSIIWTEQELEHWLEVMNDEDWKKTKTINTHYELMKILDPVYGAVEEFPGKTLQIAKKVIRFIKD